MSTREIKIGPAGSENTFSVTPLPALRSFLLQPRLAPALAEVGSAFASLVASAGGGDVGAEDIGKLAPVIARFFSRLPPAELEAIVRELLAGATMDGLPLFTAEGNPFDVKMRGRTLDVWRLLWFALQVNYPDFFSLLARKPAAAESEQGPTAASG